MVFQPLGFPKRFPDLKKCVQHSSVRWLQVVTESDLSDGRGDFVVLVAESSRERTFAMAENLKKIFELTK